MITFACACGKSFSVADSYGGKRTKCPACGNSLAVPQAESTAAVEDDAFRMLNEGPDPAPSARPSWQTETLASPPPPAGRPPATRRRETEDLRRAVREADRDDDRGRSGFRITLSAGVVTGALMMLGAVVWFALGLATNRIYFYPPIMFILGLVGVVRGVLGHSED